MRLNEKGFTMTELLVALPIFALLSVAAMVTIFQIFHLNGHNNDYMTAVRQVENAGYWIGRDTQMAQSVTADNLTLPDFILISWTEWDDDEDEPAYHSVRYFFEGMTDSLGTLKRYHWSSDGSNEQTLIAQYIYYNSANTTYTSSASYQGSVLAVKLTSFRDDILESREYKIVRRPYF